MRDADHMTHCQHPGWLTGTARDVWALCWTESLRDFITVIQKSQRSFWRMSSTRRWRRTSSARYMTRWGRFWRYSLLFRHSLWEFTWQQQCVYCSSAVKYKRKHFIEFFYSLKLNAGVDWTVICLPLESSRFLHHQW